MTQLQGLAREEPEWFQNLVAKDCASAFGTGRNSEKGGGAVSELKYVSTKSIRNVLAFFIHPTGASEIGLGKVIQEKTHPQHPSSTGAFTIQLLVLPFDPSEKYLVLVVFSNDRGIFAFYVGFI